MFEVCVFLGADGRMRQVISSNNSLREVADEEDEVEQLIEVVVLAKIFLCSQETKLLELNVEFSKLLEKTH